ncbi:FAD/NAD(P)-binding domain-containing protein [Pseudovirgaria hyperparasitica]|uniref:FAD/NAD(P)-binding domain-containing protein n=1 Tax=Pseudovirgaria hyperparasitica TaxID=470096 RepID=A0A6A6WKI0_9PEZI|nr:FAD/NAD(P)-binding domain-containing protein [Pseudovirgaria hyperparasitica]KAF2762663.1 FAD/NAD(P)-binding domain-containing protein [Pseudovirgaria hyperparasitica]
MTAQYESTDVLIIGAGPTGLLLSSELGLRCKTRNIVLEKDTSIYKYPRAFTLGQHSVRLLQGLGLYSKIYSEIGYCSSLISMVGGTDSRFQKTPFLERELQTGHSALHANLHFKQPVMERILHDLIHKDEYSELRTGCNVTSISEDDDWVYVEYEHAGLKKRVKSRFLVGADGKIGYTRKKYLEPKGVIMESTLPWTMLAGSVNILVKRPTPESHPDFPLWAIGYTPDRVLDAFIPNSFIFKCNPNRPVVSCRLGRPSEDPMPWRFEIATRDNEDGMAVLDPNTVMHSTIYPYLRRPGSDFGVHGMVEYPHDCLELVTVNPYRYSARTCNRWFIGRSILAGDAAHVFPPFAGLGVECGLMDASGLAWRLAHLLNQPSSPSPQTIAAVLSSWERERRTHVVHALSLTLRNAIWIEQSHVKSTLTQWLVYIQRLVPAWKAGIENPNERPVEYAYEPGVSFVPIGLSGMKTRSQGASMVCPQIGCVVLGGGGADAGGEVRLLDDILFDRAKTGVLQLLVLLPSAPLLSQFISQIADLIPRIASLSDNTVLGSEAVLLLFPSPHTHSTTYPSLISLLPTNLKDTTLLRPASLAEYAASALLADRPYPAMYNEGRIHEEFPGARYVLVRLDRVVFAACGDEGALEGVLRGVGGVLGGA